MWELIYNTQTESYDLVSGMDGQIIRSYDADYVCENPAGSSCSAESEAMAYHSQIFTVGQISSNFQTPEMEGEGR